MHKAYTEWLSQHVDDIAVRQQLGSYQVEHHDYPAALKTFETLLGHAPDNLMALNNLAWLYYEAADERALEFAEKAYRLMPDSPEVMDTLGWILVRNDEIHRGLKLIEQARKALPQEPNIGYHYAYALAETEAKSRAEAVLSELLDGDAKFDGANDARALLRRVSAKPSEGATLDF